MVFLTETQAATGEPDTDDSVLVGRTMVPRAVLDAAEKHVLGARYNPEQHHAFGRDFAYLLAHRPDGANDLMVRALRQLGGGNVIHCDDAPKAELASKILPDAIAWIKGHQDVAEGAPEDRLALVAHYDVNPLLRQFWKEPVDVARTMMESSPFVDLLKAFVKDCHMNWADFASRGDSTAFIGEFMAEYHAKYPNFMRDTANSEHIHQFLREPHESIRQKIKGPPLVETLREFVKVALEMRLDLVFKPGGPQWLRHQFFHILISDQVKWAQNKESSPVVETHWGPRFLSKFSNVLRGKSLQSF